MYRLPPRQPRAERPSDEQIEAMFCMGFDFKHGLETNMFIKHSPNRAEYLEVFQLKGTWWVAVLDGAGIAYKTTNTNLVDPVAAVVHYLMTREVNV